jgi:hypothetical protein
VERTKLTHGQVWVAAGEELQGRLIPDVRLSGSVLLAPVQEGVDQGRNEVALDLPPTGPGCQTVELLHGPFAIRAEIVALAVKGDEPSPAGRCA